MARQTVCRGPIATPSRSSVGRHNGPPPTVGGGSTTRPSTIVAVRRLGPGRVGLDGASEHDM